MRVVEVEPALYQLLADTALAGIPVFPVSATTGLGIEALQNHLHAAPQSMQQTAGEGGRRQHST